MAENQKNKNDCNITQFDQIDTDLIQTSQGRLLPILVNTSTKEEFYQHVLKQNKTEVGRSDQCEIKVDSTRVSRFHAAVYYDNLHQPQYRPKCVLEDLNSRNGTFVNGKRIEKPTPIDNGDTLIIGDQTFRYDIRNEKEFKIEQSLMESVITHGKIPDFNAHNYQGATLRVLIPKETFTPRKVRGQVQILTLTEARFITDKIDQHLFQLLLSKEKFIQCEINFEDFTEPLAFYGKMSWIHYDNKTIPPTCALGVEFQRLTDQQKSLIALHLT
jgi:pSer/pThr/pTyr-binding forkhead associated (FHA) protein